MNDELQKQLKPQTPVQLVPTKSDFDVAEELKKELMEALEPVTVIATKAMVMGFQVQMNMSPDSFKQVRVVQLQLIKVF